MAEVEYINTTCRYRGTAEPALVNLNLTIADGEFMVLVGPSGSGKSTALRVLAGLEEVTSGEIRIGGKDVGRMRPEDRDIAMVFQNYALYPHMTVAENMGFALKLRGVRKAERSERVLETARLLDLEPYLSRKPKALSGGQRQRAAMGRAIVRQPGTFLMDEPLSNLDAKLRTETRASIRALQRRLGTTTIFVTHDQTEAMTLGDRVAVLNHGALQQVGAPRDLYDHPVNLFVAGFVGSPAMNTRKAEVTEDGLILGEVTLSPTAEVMKAVRDSGAREVVLGIRPEHVVVRPASTGLKMCIAAVEELGPERYVMGSLATDAAGERPFVFRQIDGRPPPIGETVTLVVDQTAVQMFDPKTELRIGASRPPDPTPPQSTERSDAIAQFAGGPSETGAVSTAEQSSTLPLGDGRAKTPHRY
jgi:multiple sugar transport system ATP-binding protein